MAGDKIKDAFIDTLKGKPLAKDKFGTIIGIGDYLCWGTGSQAAANLNFGRVVKINYNKANFRHEAGTIVSSISTVAIEKNNQYRHKDYKGKIINGYVRSSRKKTISNISASFVLEHPPKLVTELCDDQ